MWAVYGMLVLIETSALDGFGQSHAHHNTKRKHTSLIVCSCVIACKSASRACSGGAYKVQVVGFCVHEGNLRVHRYDRLPAVFKV